MALLGYLEIFIAIFCFFMFWYLRRNRALPTDWPVLGMLPGLLIYVQRMHESCIEILSNTGGTFLFKGPWFTKMDMLATVDPANVHYIMSSNFSNFPKGPKFREIFDVLGDGIFNADQDLWKAQRKVTRALINHHQFLKFLLKISLEKVEKGIVPILEHFSKTGQVFDLQDVFQRLTFDTTCTMITSYDPGCLSLDFPDVPFAKAMDDAEEAIFMRHVLPESVWKLQRWLGIGEEKKLSEAWTTLDKVIGNYVAKKRGELSKKDGSKEQDEEGFDLLTFYIKEDELTAGLRSDDMFLRDTVLNLMIAGRDTTSSGLTWLLWLVSTHPIVERKIREELRSVVTHESSARGFHIFEAKDLSKMVYLHGAICESLRLYPPVPFQHKEPIVPGTLPSGHYVHPNMKVMFSLYAMGRMESIWGKDCWEFKPERWITERGTIRHEPSYKFLAFNAGPRTCLGKEVAFTQIKAVAATIIHNYQVHVVKTHPVVLNVSVILYMKHGLKVTVSKRDSSACFSTA